MEKLQPIVYSTEKTKKKKKPSSWSCYEYIHITQTHKTITLSLDCVNVILRDDTFKEQAK